MTRFVSLTLITALFTTPVFAADLQKGKTLYEQRCATCHGDKGAGDGAIAAALPPEQKPRDLTTADMKFAKDDAKFKELLKKGGAAVGLNVMMAPQADLSDDDIDSLLLFVHSLKK